MKKFLSFLLLMCFLSLMNLQSQTLFTETFNGSTLPAGWQATNQASNWLISNSNNAGGEPRELMLYYNPSFNGKTRMVSPVINLSGVTDLTIEFLHYLNNYTSSHVIGIETTSDGGVTWNPVFQKTFSSSTGGKIVELINTPDVGSSTFQFCLFYQGYSYNINYWYFDNFELFARYDTDAVMTSINNSVYNLNGDHSANFTFNNKGASTINSIEVKYQIGDYPAVTETFSSLNLPSLSTRTLSFSQTTAVEPGTYELTVEILSVNGVADENPANNVLVKDFITATQTTDRKVCIEHFTSSTCQPCVSVNNQMRNLLNNPDNANKFGITKYQMNWPGSGDPYYTAEGGVRRDYYKVSGVPTVYFNAKASGVNQSVFNNALAEPAFAKVTGSFSVDGNNITINGIVQTYIDMFKRDVRLYVVVNEKRTTGNTGGNGETEFFHVMMKMLPNGEGKKIVMNAGETYPFQHVFNMSSTKVEEMDDLEVHVFIQDYGLKYIFNSSFLSECDATTVVPDNFEAQQTGNDVVLNWDDAHGTSDRFAVKKKKKMLVENVTTTSYTHENVPLGEHTYWVLAADGDCISYIAETTIKIKEEEECDDPQSFNGEFDAELKSVVLTWDDNDEFSGTYTLFFNEDLLEENITITSYTHEDVPEGTHTYGVIAVGESCTSNVVETDVVVIYDGISDFNNKIKIYPNPANDYIFIEGEEIESIVIYNNVGQLIQNIIVVNNVNKISTKDFSAGLYHLRIHTKLGTIQTGKFIINK
jgi:hypothetical protein